MNKIDQAPQPPNRPTSDDELRASLEILLKQAGVTGYRLQILEANHRLNGRCDPWPARRVSLSRGVIDAGPNIARAVLAHEVGHTRQRCRWMFLAGPPLLTLVGLQPGQFAPALVVAGAWIFLQYSFYEFGADKWACERVGSDAMAKVLEI